MELTTQDFPTCVAVSNDGRFVVGTVDGSIRMASFNIAEEVVDFGWQFNMKAPIRKVMFDRDGTQVLAICKIRAVYSYDVETGVRTRCIMEGTKGLPTSICLVPPTAPKYQFATGCEKGEICTWDFRADEAKICKWKEQSEDINALIMDTRHCMLSASSDGTLAAFDMRKRKLRTKSEVMASELLSVCVSDKYVYAGGADGYLEIFNLGEYGNIVGRAESGFDTSVNDIIELRRGLLLTSSESSNCMRLLNVQPNKKLGIFRKHDDSEVGVDTIAVSPDRSTMISLSSIYSSLMLWPLAEMIIDIPVLRADKIEKRKQPSKEAFFDDLIDSHKKRKVDDSDDEDGSDKEEDEEDEEEEEDSDEEGTDAPNIALQESDDDEDEEINEEGVTPKENNIIASADADSADEIDEEEELDEEEEETPTSKTAKVVAAAIDVDEESDDDEEDEELEEEIEAAVRRNVPVPTVEDDSGEESDDEEVDEDEEEEVELPQSPLKPKTPPPKPKTPQSVKRRVKPKTPQSARKIARKGAAAVGKGKNVASQQEKGKPRWKY